MTTWAVSGADRDSGEDRVIHIEAATSADAQREAADAGLLVADVAPLARKTTKTSTKATTARATPAANVSTGESSIVAGLIGGVGWIIAAIGAAALIGTAMQLSRDAAGNVGLILVGILPALGIAAVGLLLVASSLALYHLARIAARV